MSTSITACVFIFQEAKIQQQQLKNSEKNFIFC